MLICDNDSSCHARKVIRCLEEHPRPEMLYGARYSPHGNPAEQIWGALKNYVANTAVTWPGRLRQIHAFFRARSPDEMPATAAPPDQPLAATGLRAELLECRSSVRAPRPASGARHPIRAADPTT